MSVNGIEIKVGQKWRRRDGSTVSIIHAGETVSGLKEAFTVADQNSGTYTCTGRYALETRQHSFDLVELIEDAIAAGDATPMASTGALPTSTSAPDLLDAAAGHMRDRAATYDKPEGERSMAQTVSVFNQFHGTSLTEAQGWHFMQILKDVRLFANPTNPHRDSVEDGVAYSALKGEAILKGGV